MCLNYWGEEIKENRMDGHVAGMWERRIAYRVLVGNLREKVQVEVVSIDGKVIVKWILKK
jgi:hypothetical protein